MRSQDDWSQNVVKRRVTEISMEDNEGIRKIHKIFM